jgi:signal transduction histidine kinase
MKKKHGFLNEFFYKVHATAAEKIGVAITSEEKVPEIGNQINKELNKKIKRLLNGKIVNIIIAIGLALSLIGLYLLSLSNYLLFHCTVEIFGIAIGCITFAIAWNSRRIMNCNFLLLIGIAFLFVSAFSFLHTIAYQGMGIFPNVGANLATQLWIITRYMFSISMLIAVIFANRRIYAGIAFVGYSIASALVIGSIFYWENFPQAYTEGIGLTQFKVISEYVISGILLFAIALLFQKRRNFDRNVVKLVISSMAIAVAAEMAFTLYVDVNGVTNVIGHLLMMLSVYFIYKALVETALAKPYDLLFRNLKKSETDLTRRATELTDANRLLAMSLEERKKMQEQLEEYGKQLEILVEKKTKQLKEVERLATIGQTAGMVGHDIRNPLQGIVSELYLESQEIALLPTGETKTNLQESIRSIEANLYYIDKIVSDLQDYARPLVPVKHNMKIEKAVEDALTIVAIPENVQVSIWYEKDLPQIKADPIMTKRILVNLVQNAVQAMPNGGELTISATQTGKHFFIYVEDTGEGIPENAKEKIFTPLFTTKSKGQGFGLAVVKRLTEAQDGTITYHTQQGKGTKFTIQFPA